MYFPRLLDLRQDADKSQKEIAALLGIDQRTYSNYETGKREIPVHFLIILADYYKTTIDYMVGRNGRLSEHHSQAARRSGTEPI